MNWICGTRPAGERAEAIHLVEELRAEMPHTVRLLRETKDDRDSPHWRENCHAYAFRLFESEQAWRMTQSGLAFPTSVFVASKLLPLMPERIDAPLDGDIAVHFSRERLEHTGRVSGDGVHSKWGATGHAWEHGVFEVPLMYRQNVRFFEPLQVSVVADLYREFAESSDDVRYPRRQG